MAPHRKKRKVSDAEAPQDVADLPEESNGGGDGGSGADVDDSTTPDQRRSLFVRSLPASVTSEKLAAHFSDSYPIKHAVVVQDPQTKISRGFGFVTFTDAEDAHAAAEQFNNSTLDNRKIKVEIAQARHRDLDSGAKKGENLTAVKLRAELDQQKQGQEAQPPRLIVRNLPWSISTAEDLTKLFQSYGKVKHAVVPKRAAGSQYGFGIVIIRGKKNAQRALDQVNGKEIDGRTLAVDWAVDKDTWQQLQQQELQNAAAADHSDPDSAGPANETRSSGSDSEGESDDGVEVSSNQENETPSLADEDDDEDGDDDDDEDNEDEDEDEDDDDDDDSDSRETNNNTTVFIRNLPYTTTDEDLLEHFRQFGPVRYARVVYDHNTDRPRGTAFVCFFNESDAKDCVKNSPKKALPVPDQKGDKKRRGEALTHSVLQNEAEDPTGRYTLASRVLNVTRALSREEAAQRVAESAEKRLKRDGDKRRLYLLSEGTISATSPLYAKLGKAELDIRESSAKQRQKLIKNNPNLCLSLTRLSIRNLPRHIGSKELKELARQAVVGFATDVKAGRREALSKEELKRGSDEMKEAERQRKLKGVGVVKQAKVVFEGKEGSKVKEGLGGRSRGYGFIEYHTHRSALSALRWLNGHEVEGRNGERKKRLVVEFAIEDARVVMRRSAREKAVGGGGGGGGKDNKAKTGKSNKDVEADDKKPRPVAGVKRKRNDANGQAGAAPKGAVDHQSRGQGQGQEQEQDADEKNKIAKRNRIISKKRQQRRNRKA